MELGLAQTHIKKVFNFDFSRSFCLSFFFYHFQFVEFDTNRLNGREINVFFITMDKFGIIQMGFGDFLKKVLSLHGWLKSVFRAFGF